MSNIGEKIKELRTESGTTQLQLGGYAGCSGQVISNIERGYTNPSAQVLNKIAEFFHVPSDYLLGKSKSQWIALDPETRMPCIGSRISDLMQDANMSPEDLANRVEISVQTTLEILSGAITPNIDVLAKISKALNTSIVLDRSCPVSDNHIIRGRARYHSLLQGNVKKRETDDHGRF